MKNTIERKGYTFRLYKPFFSRQWRWQLKAKNGNIIAASTEAYKNRIDCLDNFKIVCNIGSEMIDLTLF